MKRPSATDRVISLFNYPGGRIHITNYTFEQLLEEAFSVQQFQIAGAPGWIDDDRFMIEAKPSASSKLGAFTPSNSEAPLVNEQRQMLLTLLIDRFQLKFHRESKDGPVYLLVKGSSDPKLQPTTHPNGRMFLAGLLGGGQGSVLGGNASMDFVASQLSRSVGRPVLDRTGLTGGFDFTLARVYDPQEHDLVAIAERTVHDLNLKLESSRGPIEIIFIDHVERPSAN